MPDVWFTVFCWALNYISESHHHVQQFLTKIIALSKHFNFEIFPISHFVKTRYYLCKGANGEA